MGRDRMREASPRRSCGADRRGRATKQTAPRRRNPKGRSSLNGRIKRRSRFAKLDLRNRQFVLLQALRLGRRRPAAPPPRGPSGALSGLPLQEQFHDLLLAEARGGGQESLPPEDQLALAVDVELRRAAVNAVIEGTGLRLSPHPLLEEEVAD